MPCDPAADFLIEVNWHELRILGIWASNWAAEKFGNDVDSARALRGILSRLERQAPGMPPLTLGGELRLVRESGFEVSASTIPSEGFVVVNGPGAVGFAKKPEPKL
ncbi:MAG: hypothetical protein EPO32_14785 [Anaerolineae bacterium]|nr:MAG: hypothetical protein EPO32_14785 [Anaerolineae bacterium]